MSSPTSSTSSTPAESITDCSDVVPKSTTIVDILGDHPKVTSFDFVFDMCALHTKSIALDIWLLMISIQHINSDDAQNQYAMLNAILDILHNGFTVSKYFYTYHLNHAIDIYIEDRRKTDPSFTFKYFDHDDDIIPRPLKLRRSERITNTPIIINDAMDSANVGTNHGFLYHVKPEKYSWVSFRLPKHSSDGYYYFKCELDDDNKTEVHSIYIVDM